MTGGSASSTALPWTTRMGREEDQFHHKEDGSRDRQATAKSYQQHELGASAKTRILPRGNRKTVFFLLAAVCCCYLSSSTLVPIIPLPVNAKKDTTHNPKAQARDDLNAKESGLLNGYKCDRLLALGDLHGDLLHGLWMLENMGIVKDLERFNTTPKYRI